MATDADPKGADGPAPVSEGAHPDEPHVILTPRGWKRWLSAHPWIFRDDLAEIHAESGDCALVIDSRGREVGRGFVSGASKIALRAVMRRPAPFDEVAFLEERLDRAAARRPRRDGQEAERLVAAEADDLPGLIVDRYADVISIQHAVPFWDRRRELVTAALRKRYSPKCIIARDDFSARDLEALPRKTEVLYGEPPGPVEIREGDVRFLVDPQHGQKTGFFLDQRESRERVAKFARGRVLDMFTGDGSFAMHCARAAAEKVIAVDSSEAALRRASANAERNSVSAKVTVQRGMAFDVLRDFHKNGEQFDLVILDPPAFAKNRGELEAAFRGYTEINSRAMRLVSGGGYLASFSCSYHMTEELFGKMIYEAAVDSGRRVQLLERLRQSLDHPIVVTHPESLYLKGVLLRIEG